MITQVPYRPEWPQEFLRIGHELRAALGDLALRIGHIGSTSVPGLAAKDVIDLQVTARRLEPALEEALCRVGYSRIERINSDHIPPRRANIANDWSKWVFSPPASQRATNLHVRVAGKPNQRYPILFRDYLRTHPPVADAYSQIKVRSPACTRRTTAPTTK
jgi:GrpB-like predicted nucleotidyltransferase (UPF0157 family)